MLYNFIITLKNQRTNKTASFVFDFKARDYLSAWKMACEYAWGELNSLDSYWFIESIKNCL